VKSILFVFFFLSVLISSELSALAGRSTEFCKSVGGEREDFVISGERASICKFGEAVVGLKTFYHFKTDPVLEKHQAIQAFLNHAPYREQKVMLTPVVRSQGPTGPVIELVETPIIHESSDRVPALVKIMNPATAYCRQVGGKVIKMERADGPPSKACIFPDFSAIEATTLLRGPDAEENKTFTQHLRNFTKQ
jgi:putative hemolysin